MRAVGLSDKTHFTYENIIKLRNAIASMRGNNNFFLIVMCRQDYNFKNTQNVIFRIIKGDDAKILQPDFQKILDEYTFLPCPPKEPSGHD